MKCRSFCLLLLGLILASSVRADSPVVFNEIMYHPATNEAQLEWIGLQNQLSVDVDLSRWSLEGGVSFTFAEGTVIRAGDYLGRSFTLRIAGGHRPDQCGWALVDWLSNSGETVQLRNNNRRIMDEVSYGVDGDWPVAPDGAGPSLARKRPNVRGAEAANWQASLQNGGRPGRKTFPPNPPTRKPTPWLSSRVPGSPDDTGIDLGTAWRSPGYNDSIWPSGSAFYREDALLPANKNTALAPGRITYYFWTRIVLTGDVRRLQLQLKPMIDDGAVGYLNGVEVFRFNMPAGAITYSTLANSVVNDAGTARSFICRRKTCKREPMFWRWKCIWAPS